MAAKRDDTSTAQDQRKDTDRRGQNERRSGADRRQRTEAHHPERRSGRDRRQKAADGERRKVERRINEYRLPADILEFINAVNEFKSVQQKPFPTWSEIYEIFVSLGYRKVK